MLTRISFWLMVPVFLCSLACSQTTASKNAVTKSPQEIAHIMQTAGLPAKEHKALSPLTGTWRAESMWKMAPGAPEERSAAISKKKWVLNGLFVQEEYDDNNPKMPFKGIGMLGYDKVSGEYTSTWFDTMTSSTWQSSGKMSNGTIAFSGGGYCPMTDAYKEVEAELEIMNPKKHVLRMYDTTPEGKRFITMEIVYKRMS